MNRLRTYEPCNIYGFSTKYMPLHLYLSFHNFFFTVITLWMIWLMFKGLTEGWRMECVKLTYFEERQGRTSYGFTKHGNMLEEKMNEGKKE